MPSLEDLSRKQLQALAKKHGLRANQKSVDIIAKLKLLDSAAGEVEEEPSKVGEEPSKVGEEPTNNVKWFLEPGIGFALGIELYKGGFPIVSGDTVRTYIKVYMRGLPHTEMTKDDVVCQLFYLSSGANSHLGGIWIPSNVTSLKLHRTGARSEWKWKWFIQKKPWFIGEHSEDGYNPAMRFGGDPCIAMVSLILGGFRTSGEPDSAIDTLYEYVKSSLKRHLTEKFGKKEGTVMYRTMMDYYVTMSGFINKYLLSNRHIRPKCDDYDLDMWTGTCTSYNWFAPFDADHPKYIPNLDPLGKDSLWEERSPGKLVLNKAWLDYPSRTMKYLASKDEAEQGFPGLSGLDRAKKIGRWRIEQRQHFGLHHGFPPDITSREKLRERSD